MNPFHIGQKVVLTRGCNEVFGTIDQIRFSLLRITNPITAEKYWMRSALASVDKNGVVHANREALRKE